MCVEKIEYFYPVENGNFTFSYHSNFDQKETTMNVRFNYGLYKLNTRNINYKIKLQIEQSDGKKFIPVYKDENNQNGRVFNFDSGNITYAGQINNNLGNAYFYIDTGNIIFRKNSDYRATLVLLDAQEKELDQARCYFDVKDDE
ncbi:MAG TPA: hypothetical protein K8V21_04350 [Weissella thailandensis]|uniref:hypothetical protein n=1 Tax=Weissella thailandensis TaxID=89061 RepID=UPI001DD0399B|nr:hypothetical protein [Weissella thailandensis]HJG84599.1 hypothetical protein [Weissella thailandensis]